MEGTSLAVHWLRPQTSMQWTRIWSPVRELRSPMQCSAARKKEKKKKQTYCIAQDTLSVQYTVMIYRE